MFAFKHNTALEELLARIKATNSGITTTNPTDITVHSINKSGALPVATVSIVGYSGTADVTFETFASMPKEASYHGVVEIVKGDGLTITTHGEILTLLSAKCGIPLTAAACKTPDAQFGLDGTVQLIEIPFNESVLEFSSNKASCWAQVQLKAVLDLSATIPADLDIKPYFKSNDGTDKSYVNLIVNDPSIIPDGSTKVNYRQESYAAGACMGESLLWGFHLAPSYESALNNLYFNDATELTPDLMLAVNTSLEENGLAPLTKPIKFNKNAQTITGAGGAEAIGRDPEYYGIAMLNAPSAVGDYAIYPDAEGTYHTQLAVAANPFPELITVQGTRANAHGVITAIVLSKA